MYRRDNLSIFELQKNTKNIRNFCILAHVDHGIVILIVIDDFSQFFFIKNRKNYTCRFITSFKWHNFFKNVRKGKPQCLNQIK